MVYNARRKGKGVFELELEAPLSLCKKEQTEKATASFVRFFAPKSPFS